MAIQKFTPLHVNNLTVEELYSLGKSTVDMSTPVVAELGTISNAALTGLTGANAALGASLNKNQTSALTGDMQSLDSARDSDLSSAMGVVRSYLKSSDPVKKAAASALQLFLAPYKGAGKLPIDVESGVLFELMAKYNASAELQSAAQTLGINGVFTSLATNNTAFDKLYNSRTGEKASQGASASSLKTTTIDAYTQYCTAIEQALAFTPSDTLQALFNQLDALRRQYRPLENVKKEKDATETTAAK